MITMNPCQRVIDDNRKKDDKIATLWYQTRELRNRAREAERLAKSNEKYNPITIEAWKEKLTKDKTRIENKLGNYFVPEVKIQLDRIISEIDQVIERKEDSPRFLEFRFEELLSELKHSIKNLPKQEGMPELQDLSNEIHKIAKNMTIIPSNKEIISHISSLENENKSLLTSNSSLGTENKKLIDTKNSIAEERDSLKRLNESFKGDKERLVSENQRLVSLLEEFNSLPENTLNQKVFPYVNWGKANSSNAWYKAIDWSTIPFNRLSEDEINGLDWSKIDYTQAQSSGSFNITARAWDQINEMSEKLKKKVYKKIDWSKIKFNSMTTGASDVFDWSFVDMKNIPSSPGFTLDVVEIDEIKGTKNFKQLCKLLKKESSLSNGYLAEASDKTLQEIGYENFVGKITDKKMQEFTTNNGDKYTLVMKPLSYERADAVARAMGGQLAEIDSNEVISFNDNLTGILSQDSVFSNLEQDFNLLRDPKVVLSELLEDPGAWFGDSATDDTSAYNALKLEWLSSSGVLDVVNAINYNSLWFIVETEAITAVTSTDFL